MFPYVTGGIDMLPYVTAGIDMFPLQVLGPLRKAVDVGDADFMITGTYGILVVGPNCKVRMTSVDATCHSHSAPQTDPIPNCKVFEKVLMSYLGLLSKEMFINAVFVRTFILSDVLSKVRMVVVVVVVVLVVVVLVLVLLVVVLVLLVLTLHPVGRAL